MFDFIKDKGVIDEKTSLKIFTDVLRNADMFNNGIVHQDINEENIIINEIIEAVKLIDFDAATFVRFKDNFEDRGGTRVCLPPEWIKESWYTHESRLVWSLGLLMYGMTYGTAAFDTDDEIINGCLILDPKLSESCRNFISCCLTADITERFTLNEMINHPWITTSM